MRNFEAAIHDKVLQRNESAGAQEEHAERSELSGDDQKMIDENLKFMMLRKKAEARARGRTG